MLEKFSIPNGYLFYPAQFWYHENHAGLLQAVSLLLQRHDVELEVLAKPRAVLKQRRLQRSFAVYEATD